MNIVDVTVHRMMVLHVTKVIFWYRDGGADMEICPYGVYKQEFSVS